MTEPNNDGLSKDDILDILETPDEDEKPLELETKKEDVKDGDEEPKEEEDELKEIEEELKEPDESDLELMTPVRRREILKEFPELFKKFPYLEKAYYREQKFTEIFPTIPDAEEAREKAELMNNFETKVIQEGDIGSVLSAIKADNEESFNRVVDNLLPALQKASEPAYYHVLGNVIKSTIIQMVQESQNLGEENGASLKAAANILNQFIFGSTNFTRPEALSKPKSKDNDKENEIKSREQALIQRQFDSVSSDLQTRVDNQLRATIDGNIDPKETMSAYVKKNATRDAFDSLEALIEQDSRFKSLLNKLWERAVSDGFSRESQDRIKSAYLSKAKTLLPTVIKKARNDALKGSGKREETPTRKAPIIPGKSTSHSEGGKKEIPKGMKTVDFFMQD